MRLEKRGRVVDMPLLSFVVMLPKIVGDIIKIKGNSRLFSEIVLTVLV